MTTDEFAFYDAAYVVGALSPTDRREFEDHLKVCAACAFSVSELAGLPGLMSRVSIDQLTAEAEPLPETLPGGVVAAEVVADAMQRPEIDEFVELHE